MNLVVWWILHFLILVKQFFLHVYCNSAKNLFYVTNYIFCDPEETSFKCYLMILKSSLSVSKNVDYGIEKFYLHASIWIIASSNSYFTCIFNIIDLITGISHHFSTELNTSYIAILPLLFLHDSTVKKGRLWYKQAGAQMGHPCLWNGLDWEIVTDPRFQ